MPQQLIMTLAGTPDLELVFDIIDSPVALLWYQRWLAAIPYPLDHPDRFYGFGTREQERQQALSKIQRCVQTINEYQPIIQRSIHSVDDQDTLNYLHHIFEHYHGLLDQQYTDFWHAAPGSVKQALAELNLAVHRCESVQRQNRPRVVCTWFGVPKTHELDPYLVQRYGVLDPGFGTVCLNYVEIGKTLLALAKDDDKYIAPEAFQPFRHYSADFVVRFHDFSESEISDNLALSRAYFAQHREFFQSQGFESADDPALMPLHFPIAELRETMPRPQLLHEIAQRQYIKKVEVQ
jgi:hypothetical protein